MLAPGIWGFKSQGSSVVPPANPSTFTASRINVKN